MTDLCVDFEPPGNKARATMLTAYGSGLSYTTFRYGNLQLADSVLSGSGSVRATVRVTNTGPRPGKEAVLWFLTNEVGRITRPVRLRKHFEKQEFKPGESRELTFTIQPSKGLSHPAASSQRLPKNDFFTPRVGDQVARFRYAGATAQAARPAGGR